MAETYDLIVRGGEVVNHAGRGLADVGVRGGKIAAVGDLSQASADEVFDATLLSDEMTLPGDPGFTGAFVGMACQDMSGQARPAHFAWFDYRDFAAGAPAALSDPAPGAARKQGRARTG